MPPLRRLFPFIVVRGAVLVLSLAVGLPLPLSADWRAEVGWHDLARWLGEAPPDGQTIRVGQIEATAEGQSNYLPQAPLAGESIIAGTSNFAGKLFHAVSGPGTFSGHASGVGNHFYGLAGSLAPGVSEVYCQAAGSFVYLTLGTPYVNEESPIPSLESPRRVGEAAESVQSHAYISRAADIDTLLIDDVTARIDYFSAERGVLAVVGLANGATSTVPPLWNNAYNVLSVGRSDGQHSSGDTLPDYVGPGRTKPDLVVPTSTTSAGTGAIASAVALLQAGAVAESLGDDAVRPEVLKAILLAGASKAPFPAWSNETRPLDPHWGAGQLDVLAAHRILLGGGYAAGPSTSPAPVGRRGWSLAPVSAASPALFSFTIDPGAPAEFAVALVWNRIVREVRTGSPLNRRYTYEPDPLADLALTLSGPDIAFHRSDSAVDNVEHLFLRSLPPGHYTLTVSSTSPATTLFALAWRAELQLAPSLEASAESDPTGNRLRLSRLRPDWPLTLERSADLKSWTEIHSFTPADTTYEWTDPSPSLPLGSYRLRWFAP
jgi:hypothetical protein